jgi:hypothetical protein
MASKIPGVAQLVPPCYAQRAVPDLVERAHRYIRKGHTVVLSAHSQGSLITLAAALRMKACYPCSCKYLGLVMAGSQLQWAYPRAFPAVVDLHAYQRVLGDLNGRWYVLARGTDPLGGPVLSWNLNENDGKLTACELTKDGTPGEEGPQAADPHGPGLWIAGHDWWISDPMPAAPADCGFTLHPFSTSTQRHSGYWSHPQWDRAVARAAGLKPAGVDQLGSSSGDVPHGQSLHSSAGPRALSPGTPEVRPDPADETASGHPMTTKTADLRPRTDTAAVVRCDHGVCPVQAKVAKSSNRLRVILRSPDSGRESLPGSGVRRRRASYMPTLRQEAFRSADAWAGKAGGLGELAPGRQVWP